MRFLRGSFFYTLLQSCIVLPILMPLHILYSPDTIDETSMVRASISSLVSSAGTRWLWVHAVLIWWISITWTATALWIVWGALAYRRRGNRKLQAKVEKARGQRRLQQLGEEGEQAERWTIGEDSEGIKRFRTIMVTNIPPDMRDDGSLQQYFDYYLRRHAERARQGLPTTDTKIPTSLLHPGKLFKRYAEPKNEVTAADANAPGSLEKTQADDTMERTDGRDGQWDSVAERDSQVEEVVLVRKLASIAHVKLAQRVLGAVAKNKATFSPSNTATGQTRSDVEKDIPVAQSVSRDQLLPSGLSKQERMKILVDVLSPYVGDAAVERGEGGQTVWDVLHSLPRELLDPYQSLTHLTSLFRGQNAPIIDYLTTKLSYLTLLLDEARAKPLSTYQPSSSAFVTFKDAQTARLAVKLLDTHPKRSLACKSVPAPEWTDLLWPRLMKSVYRAAFVRGWAVYLGVWAFTLIWIFPVSLLCGLASLTTIAGFIPALQTWLSANPKTASAVTSLAPVILVALLTTCICPILLLIANKGETIVTRLAIHNSVLERFWKFLMVNAVVFFSIGQSAIETYLEAFQENDFDPLPVIASAFPQAAPYFASYILLQTAIQPFFELFRFGLPTIVYVFGTRVSTTPRQRSSRTEHPTFSHFSQLPQQLLAGAIMHLFMLLNPLVIPFTLVFYGACYLVWKRQFTYVYGRLYETNGRRTSVRVLRYSMDALALAQFVLFAFFILNKAKGHAIATGVLFALTLIAKIIITRALKKRFDDLDTQEADILCPPVGAKTAEEERGDTSFEMVYVPGSGQGESDPPTVSSRFASMGHTVTGWAGHFGYSTLTSPKAARKPIPFNHSLFTSLDRRIDFDPAASAQQLHEPEAAGFVEPVVDSDPHVHPSSPITHLTPRAIVAPHHPLRPWEDIPPFTRARGYADQPAYTDDYDDFLWLPRDPLGTLDLDDTVEMRRSLTTSTGGSGALSDWPVPEGREPDFDTLRTAAPGVEEDTVRRASFYAVGSIRSRESDEPADSGPPHPTDLPLVDLPDHIGAETRSGTIRRAKRAATGLASIFRKPRDEELGISMVMLSRVNSADEVAQDGAPAESGDNPQLQNSEEVEEIVAGPRTAATQDTVASTATAERGSLLLFADTRAESPARAALEVPPIATPMSTRTAPPIFGESPSPLLGATPLTASPAYTPTTSLLPPSLSTPRRPAGPRPLGSVNWRPDTLAAPPSPTPHFLTARSHHSSVFGSVGVGRAASSHRGGRDPSGVSHLSRASAVSRTESVTSARGRVAVDQAILGDVVEEERRAREDEDRAAREEGHKEGKEVGKERERVRRATIRLKRRDDALV
ncbi:hypothetical protein Q5752_004619 [Cryptotrichosporon argae]